MSETTAKSYQEVQPSTINQPAVVVRRLGLLCAGGILVMSSAACSAAKTGPTITFDDLGANSDVIQVYQGPGEAAADRTATGSYTSGRTVSADCKTSGRMVNSVPDEQPRSSDQWIKLDISSDSAAQYATATYIKNPDDALKAIPNC